MQTSYTYAPYGAMTFTGSASNNTSQFTGRENDNDGLYFYRARYYHPLFSRFVSEDPLSFAAGDANLYAYVQASPTNFVDPTGEIIPWVAACAASAAFSVATDMVWNALNGRKNTFASALGSAATGCLGGLFGLGVSKVLITALRGAGILPIGLREASRAAFRAADRVANFTVKAKHLPGTGGGWNKFAPGVDAQAVIAQALRAEGALFKTNAQIPGSFKLIADLGVSIGTKGETAVRVIVKYPGRIITAFPVRAP